jgi:hypothetical protein
LQEAVSSSPPEAVPRAQAALHAPQVLDAAVVPYEPQALDAPVVPYAPQAPDVPVVPYAPQVRDVPVVLHAPLEQAGAAPVLAVLSALAVPERSLLADVERSALARRLCSHSPGAGSHLQEAAWVRLPRAVPPEDVQTSRFPWGDSASRAFRPAGHLQQEVHRSPEPAQVAHEAQEQDCSRGFVPVPPDATACRPISPAMAAADRKSPGAVVEALWQPPAGE